jgi:hypothetical protein
VVTIAVGAEDMILLAELEDVLTAAGDETINAVLALRVRYWAHGLSNPPVGEGGAPAEIELELELVLVLKSVH